MIEKGSPTAFRKPPDGSDLYRLLVDRVQDYAIFALDTHGYILTWNTGAERLKGYTADEVIGKHFSIFYPPERIDEGFPEHELAVAAETGRFEDEGWRIRKDGSRFWANVVITALRDDDGTLVGFAKVTRDLTERREAEEAIRKSEETFRLLVEEVKDYAIFMLDPTGHVATWNAGAERIKGYTASEIIGQSFSRFYPAADIAARKPERELEIAKKAGKYEEEGWRVRRDGTMFWANVLITAVRNRAGELVGFAKVTRDLTERRAAEQRALETARRISAEEAARVAAEEREQALNALMTQLRDANRAKSEFLAAMSHELRTPLNAIGGYTDLLTMGLSGPVTPAQVEQLTRIKRSQQHLLGVINDILNFSRVEAGQLTYNFAPVVLQEVIDGVAQMVGPLASAKSVALEAVECNREIVVWADRSKLDQIALNLVSNAVKFTEANGRITLQCAQAGDARAALVVRDTGCGIPQDQLGKIFEPFVQVGRSLTNTREGTGLGLAISYDLARAMNGDIVAASELGAGSTFTLTLPVFKKD